ncbi:MAG: CpaF family protein [Acidimicrobiia bacterium]|nr:CpaF family protein [Acidimicrobiia bacterium]
MRLGDRLKQVQDREPSEGDAAAVTPVPAPPAGTVQAVNRNGDDGAEVRELPVNPLVGLRLRAQEALFSRLGSRLHDSSLSAEQLQRQVHDELLQIVDAENAPLSPSERETLVSTMAHDILGYGPLQAYLEDDAVTEIMVSSGGPVYVERGGVIEATGSRFLSEEHLRRVIERIVSDVGRRIDESSPMVDARLPDGSRVNAVIPPLTVDGASLTVRKFSRRPFLIDDLISNQTITPRVASVLEACVAARISVLVSGGTGSGKTTFLNVLSSFIGDRERVVTIEDAVELQMQQPHVIRMETRPPNLEGTGQVTIRDLVRNSLRMRPDRIIVGEVRGGEALDMLQAMNTGHEGSLTTLHANSPRDALARLETMVLMAGMDLPLRAIREQIASAIGVIVHTARLSDGSRKVVGVSEVTGMEGDMIQLSEIFSFDWDAGVDPHGRFLGVAQPTGLRPTFAKRLAELGTELPPDTYGNSHEKLIAGGSR